MGKSNAKKSVSAKIKNRELVKKQRHKIINSTVKLFNKNGYHGTTTRMIAKASSLSIGSMYEYVSSKEDLLYRVCEMIHKEFKIAVETALSGIDRKENMLKEAIRQYFYVCDKMGDHIRTDLKPHSVISTGSCLNGRHDPSWSVCSK